MRVQPTIETYVAKLMSTIQDGLSPEQPVQMSHLYWCMASDIVTSCMMPSAREYLCNPQLAPEFGKVFKKLARAVLVHRHFSWFSSAFMKMPHWVVKLAAPAFKEVVNLQDVCVF